MAVLKVANRYFEMDEFAGMVEITTSGSFDSAFVSNAIASAITTAADPQSSFSIVTSAVSTDYWFHFRGYPLNTGTADSNSSQAWLEFYNASGVLVAALIKDGNVAHDSKCRAYGTSTVTSTGSYTFTVNTAFIMDVHINVSGATTLVEVYVAGTLVMSATNTANGGRGLPVRAKARSANVGYTNFQRMAYSEIIIGDTSTLGMRLDELPVNTAGAYSDFVGTITDLNTSDPTTGIVTGAVSERSSWNPVAYAGSGGIVAVVASGRAHRKSGTPSKLAHFLRIGGTDYDGTDRTIDEYEAWQQIWATNPATSVTWVGADLSGIEVGLKSAA